MKLPKIFDLRIWSSNPRKFFMIPHSTVIWRRGCAPEVIEYRAGPEVRPQGHTALVIPRLHPRLTICLVVVLDFISSNCPPERDSPTRWIISLTVWKRKGVVTALFPCWYFSENNKYSLWNYSSYILKTSFYAGIEVSGQKWVFRWFYSHTRRCRGLLKGILEIEGNITEESKKFGILVF